MKHLLLLSALVFGLLQSYGQTEERLWEEGDLSWSDFKGEPNIYSSGASELNYLLSYKTARKKIGNTIVFLYETRNSINPDLCWVKDDERSDQLLRYNQVMFNIVELYRRGLQSQLHRADNLSMAENKFRNQYHQCSIEIRKLQDDTRAGTKAGAIAFWDEQIARELRAMPLELVPPISDRNFGYGLNFGLGTGLFTATLGDHFTTPFSVIYGFDAAYKRNILYLNATLAGNRVKREYGEGIAIWPENIRTTLAIIDVSLGRALIDNEKHKFAPFAGLGILEFSVAGNVDEEYKDLRMVNYGFIFGLNYDFKFRKGVRLTPAAYSGSFKERAEQNVRVRMYATTASFDQIKGTSINLSIGYALFGKLIRVDE